MLKPWDTHRLTSTDLADCVQLEQQGGVGWSNQDLQQALQHGEHWGLWIDAVLCGQLFWQTVLDEAELHNVTLALAWRGQGYAYHWLKQWLHHLEQQGISRIFLEVRASNQAARQLYSRLGFCQAGVRKAYYPLAHGQREDAYLLSYHTRATPCR